MDLASGLLWLVEVTDFLGGLSIVLSIGAVRLPVVGFQREDLFEKVCPVVLNLV